MAKSSSNNSDTTASTNDAIIPCPQRIIDKVKQFEEHFDTYTSKDYSEAQLRIDFLNPMLDALGWDVMNKEQRAEAYREVVYEDAIKIGGTAKAPDYGFYIGGRAAGGGRKFFLEAKRPSVGIRVDAKAAFQLRRYAFSAQLPLSVLTNFRDFIAYDTRYKPSPKDSATAGATLQIKYTEFPHRWHEIASVFSRQAILRGAFDKYAQGKRKKGMEPLGDAFLADIEEWRAILAKEVAASNPDISVEELNFAVQRTIDRILFLRICEDRGIEPPQHLMQLLNGDRVYDRLGNIFRSADDRYNSGIFHFPPTDKRPDEDRAEPPDDLTLDLTISDKPLQQIIRGLYDTGNLYTTYAFGLVPPEILGHVYEQFLGKVITLTPSRRVKIKEKPEVRKAGGVYYTPAYIVDYIVKHTVGKLLDPPNMTPKKAEKITILDPASGSGSFLIGAYQYLLDWHLRWYLDNDPEKHCKGKNPPLTRIHSPALDTDPDNSETSTVIDYRLTTQKRKQILLNSIYGVDIDAQAVEVTKLSLLLKVLEGESQESINAQMRFLHQRALPDLGRNIKCGNSLISDDFDDTDLSEEERRKINAFNWKREFPDIFKGKKGGGFDAVIGNPPYSNYSSRDSLRALLRRERLHLQARTLDLVIEYCTSRYPQASSGCKDIFKWFIARALQLHCAAGRIGFIVPNTWFTHTKYKDIKAEVFDRSPSNSIVDIGFGVFQVTVPTSILIAASGTEGNIYVDLKDAEDKKCAIEVIKRADFVNLDERGSIPEPPFVEKLLRAWPNSERLKQSVTLREGQHIPRKALTKGHTANCTMIIDSKNMGRYQFSWEPQFCYGHSDKKKGKFRTTSGTRIIIRKTGDAIVATTTPSDESYILQSLYQTVAITGDEKAEYLLGVLNSKFMTVLYQLSRYGQRGRTMAQFRKGYLDKLPIRTIDFSNESDKAAHDRMVKLVDRMLDLHKKQPEAKSPLEKERIARDIETTDRQIDQLVYDLYGLTEEEIKIVEGATE